MSTPPDNVVPFPLNRRPVIRGCPQCGCRNDVWAIGLLLWGYCTRHATRWVVADLHGPRPKHIDRGQLRRRLEFLSAFVEVSH